MKYQEYKQEMQRIKAMAKDLQKRYIESNTPVKAPNLVILEGEILYLKMYTLILDDIKPTLYPVSQTLKPYYQNGKVYRKNWQEMKLYKPTQKQKK